MKLTRLSTGIMAGLLAVAGACGSDDGVEGAEELSRLVIAPDNQSIAEGGELQLNATAIYAPTQRSENVTFRAQWESNDRDIVFFEDGGHAVAEAPGEAIITARFGGLSATTTIFVEPTLEDILISPAVLTLAEGTTGSASATGIASDGSKRNAGGAVTWASADQDVATVDSSGTITAESAGETTTITASRAGEAVGELRVTVVSGNLNEIAASVVREEMLMGSAQRIRVTGVFDDGHEQTLPLEWEIVSQELDDEGDEGDEGDEEDEDPLVDFSGNAVIALQPGTATFKGIFEVDDDTEVETDEITVQVLAADLDPESIDLFAPSSVVSTDGQPFNLTALGNFPGHDDPFFINSLVVWQGSDNTALRLRGAEATPLSAGSSEVSAVWPLDEDDPIVETVEIQVVDSGVSSLSIEGIPLPAEDQFQLLAIAEFGSSDVSQDVKSAAIWSSDDDCAFVDNAPARAGLVTFEEPCNAEITAEYGDQAATFDASNPPEEDDED